MSLTPPITVGKLQTTLHTKAKNSPDYRFYALYDKLHRRDILEWAFVRCRNNRGAPGVDGQSFADIETYGRDRWLDELTEELRNETYRPRPVRRVFIPKGDGKLRPLGIPCIKDRVVQMAAVLVLEPIFEADLEPEQHAYRPERSALDAVRQVERLLWGHHGDIPIGASRSGAWGNFWVDCSLGGTTGTFLLVPVDQGLGAISGSTAPWSPRDLRLESSPKRAAVDRVQDSLP